MMEKYEKIRVVGRGAYGTVHLCKRIADNTLIIIKQIPVEQMTKDERQAALNEVKVLSMLDHPFIIEYYENFLEDKALMIVMEYAEGGTVFDYLQQRGNNLLEEEEILRFFSQMLLSMQHVHSKQILHRDLKTQNILLNKKKNVIKISDFGISKVLSSKSKAYTVVGTPCYISPELCEGKPYAQKSDIWALGCVLYELATLRRAFEAANLPALILKIMRGTVAPVSDIYSDELRQLILHMLELDPAKRPTVNQIMAQPIVFNAVLNLHTELGKIPCRVHRPLPARPTTSLGKLSRTGSVVSTQSTAEVGKMQSTQSMVYCWGAGITTPGKLPLPGREIEIVEVGIGRTQKAGVTKSGRLVLWEPTPSIAPANETLNPVAVDQSTMFAPRFLEGQSAVTITHVSCGDLFTTCLTDRGILMTFGSGAYGCLGHGNYNDVSQAKIVEALLGFEVILVSCGTSHVMVVTNDNEVFAWGRGDNGRLGLGSSESFALPQPVPITCASSARSVHCGVDCSMLVTTESRLLSCGSNRYNKLGLDRILSDGRSHHVEEASVFTHVTAPPICDLLVKDATLGTSHAAIVTVNGECWTFGSNQFGQLGYEKGETASGPHEVTVSQEAGVVDMVTCGDTFTTAVTTDGSVFTWGKGARGRLGREGEDTGIPGAVAMPDSQAVISICSSHGSTIVCCKCEQE